MQFFSVILSLFMVPTLFASAHDNHEDLQTPFGYVRYPYQATYTGDDGGKFPFYPVKFC